MLKTLRKKLTVFAACLTGCVVLLGCLISFSLIRSQYLQEREASFRLAAQSVENQWRKERRLMVPWIKDKMEETGTKIVVYENSVSLYPSLSGEPQEEPLLTEVFQHPTEESPFYFTKDNCRCGWLYFNYSSYDGYSSGRRQILIWQDTGPEEAYLQRLALLFGGISLISLGLVIVTCYWVAGRAIKPAQEAMERQENFVAAASHELRSPLTVLRTGFSVIDAEPEQTGHTLSLMRRETERMSRLVDELLLLAGGGQLRRQFKPETVELDTLLLDFADSMEKVAEQAGLRLEVHLPEEATPPVPGDRDMLSRLLTILTENALGYGPKGTEISFSLEKSGRWILLSVADHGPGVPDSEKERIFDRFYRGSQSRTDTDHFGLGLSVAKELAALHRGRIRALDTPGGGATFQVRLPC